ncbi:HpaII family restriction endonuclease [Tenacibaculum maritimum]|uniref:HpaII family restriction endonuclease n=1 Tax=Tenacibaculum maritimum TaxID=107401 RepID=UPI0012E622F0|nr:HpaII family restriction endonuclease [Tenacibaculum maritimum]MCD9580967.1 HpaII family restriction endonuclease [Tenacibaculum maritimum]MCD9635529.1 HpaII family restriction endonuclease [Tenacibaculum maritimum]CAA0230104.1 putative type II restriction-modification system enzyme [Tenacibaculum maritimum]
MNKNEKFTFIDLFAGIGGFHIALHNLGGKCVFSSEMDIHARKTYEHNFKKISPELFENKMFNDDIRNITASDIPEFDILCAGFPCQPFSQAGHKRGFEDNHNSERGNLFFNIVEIIQEKKPKAFFLENVRGLVKHDNGNTFKIIRQILEKELGYSFYYKVVKASDYGLPQLRPRVFIIGFRDEGFIKGFTFPPKKPLKYNMSDVWEGNCSREIGYTMRVGGRGSKIDDRRNWDAYLVDGEVKQLGVKEGKKLQGFPDNYEFPVSKTQAIKQLGNSVAIDAVQEVAKQLLRYLNFLDKDETQMKETKNKGEWTELLVFVKLLKDQKFNLSDKNLNKKTTSFNVKKVSTHNLENDIYIIDKSTLKIENKKTSISEVIKINDILNTEILENLKKAIINGKRTFTIPAFRKIQERLKVESVKGGNSNQKADIVLDIENKSIHKENEGFGIKSYLGNKPTLLNASGNTNFIYEVKGINCDKIDEINKIDTRTKLKDRLECIEKLGGKLVYKGAEKETMEYNLKLSDSLMPNIVGEILLSFYKKRISKIKKIVDEIEKTQQLNSKINYGDRNSLEVKIKKLLIDILLGFFAGTKWNGDWESNGTLVMKKEGELVGFHIIDLPALKDYLFENIKLDTPSTTRHRFGKIYKEKNNKLYFKLNLQLRF